MPLVQGCAIDNLTGMLGGFFRLDLKGPGGGSLWLHASRDVETCLESRDLFLVDAGWEL